MATYKVMIQTAARHQAETLNYVYIQLVGTDGESEFQLINANKEATFSDTNAEAVVRCEASLGQLVLIKLHKYAIAPDDSWFPSHAEVTSPEGRTYCFPIYSWISDKCVHSFRAGEALKASDDSPLGLQLRKQEIEERREKFSWKVYLEGIPHCLEARKPAADRVQVIPSKISHLTGLGLAQLNLLSYANSTENWADLDHIRKLLNSKMTPVADYVSKNWKDDAFFGQQYLNGINPIQIRQCKSLPANFPVTDQMVGSVLQGSLCEEMKRGNIFLCDYKNLDGIEENTIDGVKQILMAPLVLFHKTCEDKMKPIAIQLNQIPAEDNPIFLPTDSEYDWLLAKIFVRGADTNEHQLNVHLLRTHLLAEVFAIALMRNIPMVHPLYKLLIPHTHNTIKINVVARRLLISDDGFFSKYVASGGDGMAEILGRGLASITYSSLCLPDDICERGMDKVPNYFYRDDGLRLWDIINRFVKKVLKFYYKNDSEVEQDTELQAWIADIYQHGFLSRECSGIPQRFSRVDEVIKFVTMVIFTCSGQHAAANTGQFDYNAWLPNAPMSLQRPPPTKKGESSEDMMIASLPNISTAVNGIAIFWLLSKQSSEVILMGSYPQKHFCEETPNKWMAKFQGDLQKLSESIQDRNKGLDPPYTYLDPARVENSVTI